jgi:hypothetical protein
MALEAKRFELSGDGSKSSAIQTEGTVVTASVWQNNYLILPNIERAETEDGDVLTVNMPFNATLDNAVLVVLVESNSVTKQTVRRRRSNGKS